MTASSHSTVARVVLPVDDVDDVIALYLDGERALGDMTVTGRHSLELPAHRSVSFGSYFNAFPAAYWEANGESTAVRLTVHTRGHGTVIVYRSNADATATVVRRVQVEREAISDVDLPLEGFDGGGAYWFDVQAGAEGMSIDNADWKIASDRSLDALVTIGMTTFNRPTECHAQLRALASDPAVLAHVDRVVVVDQGGDLVADQPGFDETVARLDGRLLLVRQPNLGGSGGFSRAMLEALDGRRSRYVLLLDDDAISEPEAVLRAIRFAEAARQPTIVGGGMLHLDDRSVLYAQSEQWDERIGWVRLGRPGAYDHDFRRSPFRSTPFSHRLHRSDFNGWWMCLIPVSLLRSHGLALPLFLKGDDVEFGRRAAAAGVQTVSLPGVAVWHLGWGGKAPTRTWEAYFLHRNRLIGELLHSPRRRPTAVVLHSFLGDMKPLITLQYSAVRLRAEAVADALAGPGALPEWLETRVRDIRGVWSTYPDARSVAGIGVTRLPAVRASVPARRIVAAGVLAGVALRHLVVPASEGSRRAPEARIGARDLSWTSFRNVDSALVDLPDGSGAVWYQRSRAETWRALARSARLHAVLWWRWPRLARRFRRSAPGLASVDAWRHTFGI